MAERERSEVAGGVEALGLQAHHGWLPLAALAQGGSGQTLRHRADQPDGVVDYRGRFTA